MYNWACERYDLDVSPCDRIRPVRVIGKKSARQRVLSDAELKALWATSARIGYPLGRVTQMIMLTGARRAEAAEARWQEFDLEKGLWTIPPERFKSGVSHLVPLTSDMTALLESLPGSMGNMRFKLV